MNKWTELVLGLVILNAVIIFSLFSYNYGWTIFGKDINLLSSAWIFLKGGLFWLLVMVGVLLIILGISDLRN